MDLGVRSGPIDNLAALRAREGRHHHHTQRSRPAGSLWVVAQKQYLICSSWDLLLRIHPDRHTGPNMVDTSVNLNPCRIPIYIIQNRFLVVRLFSHCINDLVVFLFSTPDFGGESCGQQISLKRQIRGHDPVEKEVRGV